MVRLHKFLAVRQIHVLECSALRVKQGSSRVPSGGLALISLKG